jgi:uncharacterized membrane protein YidH (DUF202 family)
MLAVLGVLSALLAVVDTVPYIRDIRRGTTRPQRATWLIWSVLGVAAFAAQAAGGTNWSLVMIGTQAVLMTIVFILAIPGGEGGLRRIDLAMLALAAIGLAGWAIADEPVVATVFVVIADAIGLGLMVPKTVRDPESETLLTFALASFGALLATIAVGTLDPALLLYPGYMAIGNGLIAAIIWTARRRSPPQPTAVAGL